MAINYAETYAKQIDERFKLASVTASAVNNNYSWDGVKTVNVYSVPVAQMNDYTKSGSNRYGSPTDLEPSAQTFTLSKDRSFTFVIDRANFNDTQMVAEAGQALARQIEEVVVPEIDIYRLKKIVANGTASTAAAITKSNAYEKFLDGQEALTNAKVPVQGRICYASTAFYKAIKQDSSFIKASDIAQNMLVQGSVGAIDGVPLIVVPSSYLPTNVAFVITNAIATCSPIKLADYKIHDNPPGINGWLVEGRVYYDAFCLANKKAAIYVHITGNLDSTVTAMADSATPTSKQVANITAAVKKAVLAADADATDEQLATAVATALSDAGLA